MKKETLAILEDLFVRYPDIEVCKKDIKEAFEVLHQCFKDGHRLYTCGNGGSASDSEHMVGELVKSFKKHRKTPAKLENKLDKETLNGLEQGYPAMSLCSQMAFITAYANDHDADYIFAQQVNAYGQKDDVLFAITTSGNSKNCVLAAKFAKALGLKVIALTGRDGGEIKAYSDVAIVVPEKETYKIQERHLPIYHVLCAMIEEEE